MNDIPNQTVNDVPKFCERCTERDSTACWPKALLWIVNDVPGENGPVLLHPCVRSLEYARIWGRFYRWNAQSVNDVPNFDERFVNDVPSFGERFVNDVPSFDEGFVNDVPNFDE